MSETTLAKRQNWTKDRRIQFLEQELKIAKAAPESNATIEYLIETAESLVVAAKALMHLRPESVRHSLRKDSNETDLLLPDRTTDPRPD